MKKLLVIILLCLTQTPFLFSQCESESAYPEAMYKYWTLRDQFREHFIRNDMDEEGNLTGDGIGEWNALGLRYTKAGFGLPANGLTITNPVDADGRVQKVSENTPCNFAGEPGVPNYLDFSADGTYRLGWYIATLATEYELLRKNSQSTKVVTNELFLALQAYRRLNMAANRMNALHCNICRCGNDSGCEKKVPNLSGYSGFFLRTDAHRQLHEEFDSEEYPPDWRVGGIVSQQSCVIENSTVCEFRSHVKHVVSQDQIIGLLFGLAFVKKYIPESENIFWDGEKYNLLDMAQQIAKGMVRRIRIHPWRKISYPPCEDEGHFGPSLSNADGGDALATIHGMIKVLNYIYPESGESSTATDYSIWQTFLITPVVQFGLAGDNRRMAIELMTAGDANYGGAARDLTIEKGFLMQHIAWGLLHNKKDEIRINALDSMRDLLCNMSCEGPCQKITDSNGNQISPGPAFICNNSPIGDNGFDNPWCNGELWQRGSDHECNGTPWAYKANGLDYMMAYNMYHLAQLPRAVYADPFNPEGEVRFKERLAAVEGADYICDPFAEYTFSISSEVDFDEITWEVETPYLEIVGDIHGESCTVISHGDFFYDGLSWIRAKTLTGDCDYQIFEKEVYFNKSDYPAMEDSYYSACQERFNIWDAKPVGVNTDYKFIAVSGGTIISQNGTSAEIEVPYENQLLGTDFVYRVEITNECGTLQTGYYTIDILECEIIRRVKIYPNPVKSVLSIEYLNFENELFDQRKVDGVIIKSTDANFVHRLDANSTAENVDVSTWTEGLYEVIINVEGKMVAEPFVVTKE